MSKRILFSIDISDIPFDPAVTFASGQSFRWRPVIQKQESAWLGVIEGLLVKIASGTAQIELSSKRETDIEEKFQKLIRRYLSAGDNLETIKNSFPREPYLANSLNQFCGLRILCQDPWECLVSFICSINKNIPAIRGEIELLSAKFGEKIGSFDSKPIFSFPSAAILSKGTKSELLSCGVGFRWRFIQYVARQVAQERFDLGSLSKKSYEGARRELIAELSGKTFGVGPKVADCVLLFSLHNLEAFPLDVWMLRLMWERYSKKLHLPEKLRKNSSISLKRYEELHRVARHYFGPFCGYAQQFLYMKTRFDSHS